MCGLSAVITTESCEDLGIPKEMYRALMLGNAERGEHSTGILGIKRDMSFSLVKKTVSSKLLMFRKKFKQLEDISIWLGHTRFATHGKVTERNAHPLQKKNIFVVHNGVISNYEEVALTYGHHCEVDSEVLLPIVENEDWDKLALLSGSINFIAWNKEKNLLYVSKHTNPLFGLILENMGILAISSREEELQTISMMYREDEEGEVFEFKNDQVNIMDMSGKILDTEEIDYYEKYRKDYKNNKGHGDKTYDHEYGRDYDFNRQETKKPIEKAVKRIEYDFDKDYSETSAHYGNGKSTTDFCDICDKDILDYEKDVSEAVWDTPLCTTCHNKLEEYYRQIENEEKIGEFDAEWPEFESLLRRLGYLPLIEEEEHEGEMGQDMLEFALNGIK